MRFRSIVCAGLSASLLSWSFAAPVRAQSITLLSTPAFGQALASVLPAMREEGVDAVIKGEVSSSAAIQFLAEGQADAAFTIRPMSGEDRAIAPDKMFVETQIATQAVAVLVSRDVWEHGVRELSKEQLLQIYEREITNWKQVGGEDRPIKFYNYAQGQGVWEQFVQWLYGEIRRAPLGKFEVLVSGQDAHDTLEFNGGSISIAAPRWADGRDVFALSLRSARGPAIEPTREHFADHLYPLARPVLVIFGDKPTGVRSRMLDFLLGAKCQQLLYKSGLVPVMESAAK